MASDLGDLYQEILLEHNRRPRNFRELADATHHADGFNPLCGDQISLQLKVNHDSGVVDDVGFQGHGCAISRASASLLTQAVKGRTVEGASDVSQLFRDMMQGKPLPPVAMVELGELSALEVVRQYPVRIKCALLPWVALEDGLRQLR
ncbi:Zinc-dependent sulfurtransferase SufU [Geodia barretti]|uniref:Zinc-dependent sulfurtransferase SufU n=1 Tax=Geodia barretti TaxID=519541 RepID=A0AA35S4P0_GEOBA|nr:Zinc-dependent sulfurtransferase SufU [Geodia barretti]